MYLSCISLLVFILLSQGLCELYTAVEHLKTLVHTEEVVIDLMKNLIQEEEIKLDNMRRWKKVYEDQYNMANKNVEGFLYNPITEFMLIKRLTVDWKVVKSFMDNNIGEEYLSFLTRDKNEGKVTFPSDEDLMGTAVAITRLQDTYKLETSALANGYINNVKYGSELNAADCFELGRQLYNNGDYYHSQGWLKEADKIIEKEETKTVNHTQILGYLGDTEYQLGNIHLALKAINKLLEINPNDERALADKSYYEYNMIGSRESSEETVKDGDKDKHENNNIYEYKKVYQEICRGDRATPIEISSKFKCYLFSNNNPFLKLAPFKVEEVYNNPKIMIFHDAMSESEIETIKEIAQPRLRQTVYKKETKSYITPLYRTTKVIFLENHEHEHIGKVVRRVSHMTGLSVETAEQLQVANYGIGGHYNPHFDYFKSGDESIIDGTTEGNRIATVLFYMSDVQAGGATAFPKINTGVWPKKGTAVFWYNLFPSGRGILNTLHGACPVLVGSKWVSTVWLHHSGQEFIRPCGLSPDSTE